MFIAEYIVYVEFIMNIRIFIITFSLVLFVCLVYAGFIKARSIMVVSERPTAVRWEGFYKDKNFRDVGQSINQCYGRPIMREGVFFRSNGWFSGWSCDTIGNPDKIISLNFNPKKNQMFFCWDNEHNKPNIGQVPTYDIRVSSMEFMSLWSDDRKREGFCTSLKSVIAQLDTHSKTLIHCDAGRDRTGLISAMLAAVTAEYNSMLDDKMLTAIECDYRKTESLVEDKYGRMGNFVSETLATDGMISFISRQCGIERDAVISTAQNLSLPDHKLAKKNPGD
jgi:hypothetical protein